MLSKVSLTSMCCLLGSRMHPWSFREWLAGSWKDMKDLRWLILMTSWECLLEGVIPRHSCPISLTTDGGKEFDNQQLGIMLQRGDIRECGPPLFSASASTTACETSQQTTMEPWQLLWLNQQQWSPGDCCGSINNHGALASAVAQSTTMEL